MTSSGALPGLRSARSAQGWSQADAARELAVLGRARGSPVAAAASLKTLLSRWENGHSVPDPHYRTLLAELYGRSPSELGLADPSDAEEPTGGDLRAALAAAAAVQVRGVDLWWQQLDLARRIDDELGAAGAGEIVRAMVEQLDETLVHTPGPAQRVAVAAVLAGAASLAGAHALDGGHHDRAWRHFDRARTAAREAELPVAHAVSVSGQAAVLVDIDEAAAAVTLLEQAPAASGAAQARLDAAMAVARAATGDGEPSRAAISTAEHWLRRPSIDIVDHRDGPAVELADLHRWHGRALVKLGDPAAVAPLRRALAAGPRSARARAAVHADLALALEADRTPESAEHAATARTLATSIGSPRIAARLSTLGRP